MTPSRKSRSCRSIAWLVSCKNRHSAGGIATRRRRTLSSSRGATQDQVADFLHQIVEPGQIDANHIAGGQRWCRFSFRMGDCRGRFGGGSRHCVGCIPCDR